MNRNAMFKRILAAALIPTIFHWFAPPSAAQSVPLQVAGTSVKYTPDHEKRMLAVEFRLTDGAKVVALQAAGADGGEVPATWEAFRPDKSPSCAWLVAVDVSDPRRAKTVAKGVELVRALAGELPAGDQVAVCTLARDLAEVAGFGPPEDALSTLAGVKAGGDASLATLIYHNATEAVERLKQRSEPRKTLLLLTDGNDETPGGAEAKEIAKQKLLTAAREAGVTIHFIAYAEKSSEQIHFAGLKELVSATEGIYVAAAVGTAVTPPDTVRRLTDTMHGAGVAHLDLSGLEESSPLVLTISTDDGQSVEFEIPSGEVESALKGAETGEGDPGTDENAGSPEKEEAETDENAVGPEKEDADADEQEATAKAEEDAREKASKEAEAQKAESAAFRKNLIIAGAVILLLASLVGWARWKAARRPEVNEPPPEVGDRAKVPEPLAWLELCDAQQTRHPISKPSWRVGRGQHNDLVLRNNSVSGNHCVFTCTREGKWSVMDSNSGNGVILNGELIIQAPLNHGDVLELGDLRLRFLLHP